MRWIFSHDRLILPLLCCFAGLGSTAIAAPITLDKNDAVAEARRDPGSGICGSVTKFVNQPTPLVAIPEAEALLNKPNGDPNVAGRTARLFQNMNFSVGVGSEADFKPPTFNDDLFPYCLDPMAMPMGTDDNNIAMRIRGYLNITNTMGGNPQTIALKCDDACILRLGKSKKVITETNDDNPQLTGRRARWVIFKDPGLYPVELVYFQNSTTGYLEWSQARASVFNGDDVSVDNVNWGQQMGQFKPLTGAELFSAIVGSNPACIECGAPGMDCTSGNYCGDGLCQSCNLPDHCGPTCMTCPADRRVCSAGKCVQCTSDAQCPAGSTYNTATGTCNPTGPCDPSTCKAPNQCRVDGVCGPQVPCRTDAECLSPEICTCEDFGTTCAQKVCLRKPTMCIDDSMCAANFHCDTAAGICKVDDRYLYEGGLVGCGMGDGTRSNANGLAFLALLGLALFGVGARTQRGHSRVPARRDLLNRA